MADLATNEFLSRIKARYPLATSGVVSNQVDLEIDNPWYIITAVAFSASNRPDAIPKVFEFVISELETLRATKDDKLRLVVRMREALFKAGLISGYSRAISSLVALYEATPEELRDTKLVREVDNDKVSDLITRGDELFTAMYGSTAAQVQSLLECIHPDMGWFSKNIAYGHVYNGLKVLGQRDTSYAIVAALIAMDTPRQIDWHLSNCRRGGASYDEVCAVRYIAIQVASVCGVKWRDGVPEVKDEV
ncbi:hypothetical protein ACEPAI_5529 [Sanghuangporus weigelae]